MSMTHMLNLLGFSVLPRCVIEYRERKYAGLLDGEVLGPTE